MAPVLMNSNLLTIVSTSRRTFLLFLISVIVVLVSSTTPKPVARWDRQKVDVTQGDGLSVTCTVPDFDLLSVVRLEKRDEEKQTTVVMADNGEPKPPFAGHPRYRIEFSQYRDIGSVTVHYSRIRGEDAGTLACYKLMTDRMNEDSVAKLELTVRVPVQSVKLLMVHPDGGEQLVATSSSASQPIVPDIRSHQSSGLLLLPGGVRLPTVTLTEVSMTTGSEIDAVNSALECRATVNGSLTPPAMRLTIDGGRDVTSHFAVRELSRIEAEGGLAHAHKASSSATAAAASSNIGLGFYYGDKFLTYSTSLPDVTWNGRMLTCAASQDGFPDVIVSATVVVFYAPRITCHSYEVGAVLGEAVRVVCEVKANPPPDVTWYLTDRNDSVVTNSTGESLFTIVRLSKLAESDDHYEASMYHADLDQARLGTYRLVAKNRIGTGEESVTIRQRRDHKSAVRERDNIRPRNQPSTGGHHHLLSHDSSGFGLKSSLTLLLSLSILTLLVTFQVGRIRDCY